MVTQNVDLSVSSWRRLLAWESFIECVEVEKQVAVTRLGTQSNVDPGQLCHPTCRRSPNRRDCNHMATQCSGSCTLWLRGLMQAVLQIHRASLADYPPEGEPVPVQLERPLVLIHDLSSPKVCRGVHCLSGIWV